jgi:hypothetical protein
LSTRTFAPGGYRFIPAVFQYSGGVAAEPGFAIERVTFRRPIPLAAGFARAAEIIEAQGRPLTAFCACELRSPRQFTDAGFRAFNETYVETLAKWGIYDAEAKANPVARSNVCPEIDPPTEPCFHAFSFTVASPPPRGEGLGVGGLPAADVLPSPPPWPSPTRGEGSTFVIAGSGEAREGGATYRERTVRWGETGPDALREKAVFVLGEMERRLRLLGFGWPQTTATQVYTVHDLHPILGEEIVRRGAARQGLTWHFCRPPVEGLEFEMDCRGVALEHIAD